MLLQSKPLIYRVPQKQQSQTKWKANNLPHLVGPVRYRLKPGLFDDPSIPLKSIDQLRRARPYNHYRYDYLPLISPEHTQTSADSYVLSATKSFDLPSGASGVTRSRSHRDEDASKFTNGMTGSLADESALQTMHSDNNKRIAEAAKFRVKSSGKQISNKFQKYFTYSSNEEYLQSRAKTFAQNQFHYDLSKDETLYPPGHYFNREQQKYYRPQGAEFYRMRNTILRDQRGPGTIHVTAGSNDTLIYKQANSTETNTITISPGSYNFHDFVTMVHERIRAISPSSHLLLQYHGDMDRISVQTRVMTEGSADQFVITPNTQSLWILFGFTALQENESERALPTDNVIETAISNTAVNALGTVAPLLSVTENSSIYGGPVNFHLNRNPAFQTDAPVDASTNTFRKRYNNIQKAAPSYVSSYGLATATSLVYRKSNYYPVRTLKDITENSNQCNIAKLHCTV